VATFTTIFVVIITALITQGLYAHGIEIPIVGSLPGGRHSLVLEMFRVVFGKQGRFRLNVEAAKVARKRKRAGVGVTR
jgi:hypothetical protein